MSETKRIFRWWWVWSFEREEAWLNSMALEGWTLERVFLCFYWFVRTEPGAYTIRLEMHEPEEAYLTFMKETGAAYVGRVFQWIYFRKKVEYGPFDLFSDIDSRMEHLKRIARMLLILTLANLVIGVVNLSNPLNIAWINLLAASLLTYALGRIHGKQEALEKERMVHE